MSSWSRRQVIRGIFAALILQTPFSAEAASGPTLKCTRLGQTIIWRNRKYTCIRSGKKLIWDKGVVIPLPKKTTSAPSPQASIYTPAPVEFLICASADLKLNQPISFQNPSLSEPSRGYIVVRREKEVVAFSNRCTHEGGEVEVSKGELVCFRHLSYFDIGSGKVLSGPATRELKSYQTSEHDSKVFVIDAA
jgi:nitrite reductase/ring-hydroxylating ferredoxin subunit